MFSEMCISTKTKVSIRNMRIGVDKEHRIYEVLENCSQLLKIHLQLVDLLDCGTFGRPHTYDGLLRQDETFDGYCNREEWWCMAQRSLHFLNWIFSNSIPDTHFSCGRKCAKWFLKRI